MAEIFGGEKKTICPVCQRRFLLPLHLGRHLQANPGPHEAPPPAPNKYYWQEPPDVPPEVQKDLERDLVKVIETACYRVAELCIAYTLRRPLMLKRKAGARKGSKVRSQYCPLCNRHRNTRKRYAYICKHCWGDKPNNFKYVSDIFPEYKKPTGAENQRKYMARITQIAAYEREKKRRQRNKIKDLKILAAHEQVKLKDSDDIFLDNILNVVSDNPDKVKPISDSDEDFHIE